MRVLIVASVALLIAGALESVNSPGAAEDPLPAGHDDLRAYQDVAIEMHGRWAALDAACDEDAVFGLLYLITTGAVGDLVSVDHFEDNPLLVAWDAEFAGRYFDAYDAYHAGQPTPEPWRLAFEHADSGASTVTQNLLLGMNAHVNYDLVFSAYAMNLPQDGRKDDYDRVNDAFWNVPIPQGNEFNKRYTVGEQRNESDPLGPDGEATVELLISWREGAWGNAMDLAMAPTQLQFDVAAARIEIEAAAVAHGLIASGDGQADDFQTNCQASGHPALPAAYGGDGYGDNWFDETAGTGGKFAICHRPGTLQEQNMYANEHSWKSHAKHGDTHGHC